MNIPTIDCGLQVLTSYNKFFTRSNKFTPLKILELVKMGRSKSVPLEFQGQRCR